MIDHTGLGPGANGNDPVNIVRPVGQNLPEEKAKRAWQNMEEAQALAYGKMLIDWHRNSLMPGAMEDLTYLFHPGSGGCGDIAERVLPALEYAPGAKESYDIEHIRVKTGKFPFEHHAVAVYEKRTSDKPGATPKGVFDIWPTGTPHVYSYPEWVTTVDALTPPHVF